MSAEEGMLRLNVNLNRETAAALQDMTFRRDSTYTETVRRALAVLHFLESEVTAGRRLETVDGDGKNRREIALL